jgi:hypothetical protein
MEVTDQFQVVALTPGNQPPIRKGWDRAGPREGLDTKGKNILRESNSDRPDRRHIECSYLHLYYHFTLLLVVDDRLANQLTNYVALARERTPLVGEVSANFCG